MNAPPAPVDQPAGWRFERAVARIEPTVDSILAEYATCYWRRPYRRRVGDASITWSIDDETVLEFRFADSGPSELVVHDFGLFEPLRKAIRTRLRRRDNSSKAGSSVSRTWC